MTDTQQQPRRKRMGAMAAKGSYKVSTYANGGDSYMTLRLGSTRLHASQHLTQAGTSGSGASSTALVTQRSANAGRQRTGTNKYLGTNRPKSKPRPIMDWGDHGHNDDPTDWGYQGDEPNPNDASVDVRQLKGRDIDFDEWHGQMELMVKAFDQLNGPANLSRACGFIKCPCLEHPQPSALKIFDFRGQYTILYSTCRPCMPSLFFKYNLYPASPKQPRAAISFSLLRFFQSLRKHSSVNAYSIALTCEDVYGEEDPTFVLSDHMRKQFSEAATWLQTTRQYAEWSALHGTRPWTGRRPDLDCDDLSLTTRDLADSCPACFSRFLWHQNSPTASLMPEVFVSIDGNFAHKRKNRSNLAQCQALPPRRFLSKDQVSGAERNLNSARIGESTTADHHQCSAKVKAADPSAAKGAFGPHDITGVMGLCCRHDNPLLFCDITTLGERHHYAIALFQQLFAALGPSLTHVGVMYDIGCRFQPNPHVKAALRTDVKITWTIPLFHVYGHTFACQVRFSPRRVEGMGWCDGEGMERVWSGISNMVSSTRSMSQVERRFQLEERLQHTAAARRKTLMDWIVKEWKVVEAVQRQCVKILDSPEASYSFLKKAARLKKTPKKTPVPANFPALNSKLFDLLSHLSRERHRMALAKSGIGEKEGGGEGTREQDGNVRGDEGHGGEDDDRSSDGGDTTSGSTTESEDTIDSSESATDPSDGLARREGDREKDCYDQTGDAGNDGEDNEGGTGTPDMAAEIAAQRSQGPPRKKTSAKVVLADQLFRSLAKYHLLQAQVKRRTGVRQSTQIILRLQTALALEKPKAAAAMDALNNHLKAAFRRYKPLSSNSLLQEETLHWVSAVATEGSIHLPWWADVGIVKIVDAFDHLLRISEERTRLAAEREDIRRWIDVRIDDVRGRLENNKTRSTKMCFDQLQALRTRWFGDIAWRAADSDRVGGEHHTRARESGNETEEEVGDGNSRAELEILDKDVEDDGAVVLEDISTYGY